MWSTPCTTREDLPCCALFLYQMAQGEPLLVEFGTSHFQLVPNCKTGNIWHKLETLELGLNHRVGTVTFCKQFWGWCSWKAGGDGRGVCFCCYQPPDPTNQTAGLASVVQKGGNSKSQQGRDICFLAPASCEDKGSWGSQQPLSSTFKFRLEEMHPF